MAQVASPTPTGAGRPPPMSNTQYQQLDNTDFGNGILPPFTLGSSAAIQKGQHLNGDMKQTPNTPLSVTDVKERLSDYFLGKISPQSLADWQKYLAQNFLALKSIANKAGDIVNYIVDVTSSKKIDAKSIIPELGYKELLLSELRREANGIFGPEGAPDFPNSWEAVSMSSEFSDRAVAYTVGEDKAGYFGEIVGYSSGNVQTNMKLIRAAQEKGIKLIIPFHKDPVTGKRQLLEGLPILRADRTMRGDLVDKRLSHTNLSQHFGMTMHQAQRKALKKQEQAANDRAFLTMSGIETVRAPKPAENQKQGFGHRNRHKPEDMALYRQTDGSIFVFNQKLNEPANIPVANLPQGEYPRFDPNGAYEGVSEVKINAVTHLDNNGNEVNLDRKLQKPQAASEQISKRDVNLAARPQIYH
ncbi:hypothetical protein [Flexibacterium corallicola]|uniref:hypothetical protein n=1 Tax=Flexibacterium corallicola TaxID=3037259 RepID=UPI00286F85B6|nr:hypothetical protein [Pseudovibrio sp. M1P-2-3]